MNASHGSMSPSLLATTDFVPIPPQWSIHCNTGSIYNSSVLKLVLFNVLLIGWCSYGTRQHQYSLYHIALHITLSLFCGLLTILVKLSNANKYVPTPVTHPMAYSCNFDLWAENILMLCIYSTEFAACQYSCHLKAFAVGVDWFPEGDGCCSPALFSTPWWREEWKESSDPWQTAEDYSSSISQFQMSLYENVMMCHSQTDQHGGHLLHKHFVGSKILCLLP